MCRIDELIWSRCLWGSNVSSRLCQPPHFPTPTPHRYIAAGRDVHQLVPILGAAIENTTSFQYMALNGPKSLFTGYRWSLDTQVDFSWLQLGSLSTVLIVLLIVEALCVQVWGEGWERGGGGSWAGLGWVPVG